MCGILTRRMEAGCKQKCGNRAVVLSSGVVGVEQVGDETMSVFRTYRSNGQKRRYARGGMDVSVFRATLAHKQNVRMLKTGQTDNFVRHACAHTHTHTHTHTQEGGRREGTGVYMRTGNYVTDLAQIQHKANRGKDDGGMSQDL